MRELLFTRIVPDILLCCDFKCLEVRGWAQESRLVINSLDQFPLLYGTRLGLSAKKLETVGQLRIFQDLYLDCQSFSLMLTENVCSSIFYIIILLGDHRGIREELWPEIWSMEDQRFPLKIIGSCTGECILRMYFRCWERENFPDCYVAQFLVVEHEFTLIFKEIFVIWRNFGVFRVTLS